MIKNACEQWAYECMLLSYNLTIIQKHLSWWVQEKYWKVLITMLQTNMRDDTSNKGTSRMKYLKTSSTFLEEPYRKQ